MCGISGIINKIGSDVQEESVKKINDIISHRGPDSEGFYTFKNLGFGHRRLSILDLSELGFQPMCYLDKYWITYNGEVYNYIEIREELKEAGYHFKSDSDTEVILAAYDYWGFECFSKFNGMWSFALHDIQKNIVVFSRDRFGIKPLYYKETEHEFTFGSEIKQLLNKDSGNKVNPDVLLESMVTYIDNHTEETYFKYVFSLPQSSYMVYDLATNERHIQKYYQLSAKKINVSDEEFITTFKNTFSDSVKLRLRSDVKVGTSLSGGLDSSSIAALASDEYTKKASERFVAINAKSIDESNDESGYAKIVADHKNLDLHVVMPTYEDFLKTIDDVVYTQDEPFGSPSMFMGWHVFQKAKQLGCTVMLNGQGADEILLGYERYFTSFLNLSNLFTLPKQLYLQYINSRLKLSHVITYYFYFRISSVRIKRLKNKTFVKSAFLKPKHFKSVIESSKAFNNPEDLQVLEISKLQLPHLLRYEDRNSMRHSIETRLPFLDYRLVELAMSVPLRLKIFNGWTKYILRKSVDNELPKEIVWRKNKFGFESPDKIWLANYGSEMKKEIKSSKLLNHYCDVDPLIEKFDRLSLKDKWMYFNIARWEKVFNVEV
jgi:asparagine synthase (glutamine-hydrolysing)